MAKKLKPRSRPVAKAGSPAPPRFCTPEDERLLRSLAEKQEAPLWLPPGLCQFLEHQRERFYRTH